MAVANGGFPFTQRDVVTEIYGDSSNRSLTELFSAATGTFDSAYEGSRNSLYNFRNYQHGASNIVVFGYAFSILGPNLISFDYSDAEWVNGIGIPLTIHYAVTFDGVDGVFEYYDTIPANTNFVNRYLLPNGNVEKIATWYIIDLSTASWNGHPIIASNIHPTPTVRTLSVGTLTPFLGMGYNGFGIYFEFTLRCNPQIPNASMLLAKPSEVQTTLWLEDEYGEIYNSTPVIFGWDDFQHIYEYDSNTGVKTIKSYRLIEVGNGASGSCEITFPVYPDGDYVLKASTDNFQSYITVNTNSQIDINGFLTDYSVWGL